MAASSFVVKGLRKACLTLHSNVTITIQDLTTAIAEEQQRVSYRIDAKKGSIVKGPYYVTGFANYSPVRADFPGIFYRYPLSNTAAPHRFPRLA